MVAPEEAEQSARRGRQKKGDWRMDVDGAGGSFEKRCLLLAGTRAKAATCRRVVVAATVLEVVSSSTARSRRSTDGGEAETGDDDGGTETGGGFPPTSCVFDAATSMCGWAQGEGEE